MTDYVPPSTSPQGHRGQAQADSSLSPTNAVRVNLAIGIEIQGDAQAARRLVRGIATTPGSRRHGRPLSDGLQLQPNQSDQNQSDNKDQSGNQNQSAIGSSLAASPIAPPTEWNASRDKSRRLRSSPRVGDQQKDQQKDQQQDQQKDQQRPSRTRDREKDQQTNESLAEAQDPYGGYGLGSSAAKAAAQNDPSTQQDQRLGGRPSQRQPDGALVSCDPSHFRCDVPIKHRGGPAGPQTPIGLGSEGSSRW